MEKSDSFAELKDLIDNVHESNSRRKDLNTFFQYFKSKEIQGQASDSQTMSNDDH
jgi:hypothetical protein